MPLKFFAEFPINTDSQLEKIDFFFLPPIKLEITAPHLFPAKIIGKLLYAIYNKLNYLFSYLDFQVKTREVNAETNENTIRDYLSFLFATPFL